MLLRTFALAALTAALASGQTPSSVCQADFNTPNFDPAVSMGGPNLLLAIKTQAPSTYAATRVEIFTGNGTGTNTIALWSHDAVNNRPLAPLAGGSWQMSRLRSWQGANLSAPVLLATGTEFWVVWGPINGSQASTEGTGAGAQPYRGSFDGGQTWNGPFTSRQWKFRIYCGGPPGHYEVFGAGCFGATRTRPELGWDNLPIVGASFNVVLANGLPSSFALLTIGDSNTIWSGNPLPMSLAPQGAPGCDVLASVAATLLTPINAAGGATVPLAVPNNVGLAGFVLFDQWFVLDPAANPLGVKVSNGGIGTIGT